MALELKNISGNTYYIPGAVNTGVIINGSGCVVVDTGLDPQAGKQLWRCLQGAGLNPVSVINTHSHADHFGGNNVFREQGAQIYASQLEKAIIENPYLEPFYLFSAAPVKELTTRFLMAPASPVDGVLQPGSASIAGISLEVIALPGHSPGQVGLVTEDNVCFVADAYFAGAIIEKYGMPYCVDITQSLQTLHHLSQTSYSYYLPCHGEPTGNPAGEIQANVSIIEKTLALILSVLEKGPCTREEALAAVLTAGNRKLDAVQYVLNHGAVTACLSHLHKTGHAEYQFADGKMLWQAK